MVDVHQSSGALLRSPGNSKAVIAPIVDDIHEAVLQEPWVLCENDVQWLIFLGKKRYGADYDYVTVEGWFRNQVLKNPMGFHPIRLGHSFLIGMLNNLPWTPAEIEYHVVFVCAEEGYMWEAAKLLRTSIDWSRKRGCTRWKLSSDTEYDLAPFARRLGATEISPRFTLNL